MPELEDAISEVSRKARASDFPALTADEVEEIVAGSARAAVWEAEADYTVGDRVVPTTRDGRVRKCVVSGTSGEEEPDWTDRNYARDEDGTVTWEEAGPDVGLYDIRRAVHECLTRRALRAAQSGEREAQAVSQRLFEMARAHSPVELA